MTTADHRHDADQYSDQATDDRRVDQDGTGYDTDRPAGGYGDAHDAPATQDEHGDGHRLDTDATPASDGADPAGAHPVDVDSNPTATTDHTATTDYTATTHDSGTTDQPGTTDQSANTDRSGTTDQSANTDYSASTDYSADHSTAAGDGTPVVPGTATDTRTTAAGTATTGTTGSGGLERLVPANRVEEYTTRWDAVKGEFVDEPRQAVAKADKLVGELLDELDQLFRKQRSDLEHGLDADETSTEDLRLALRKYRSFFDRLLAL